MRISDWISDVCSSELDRGGGLRQPLHRRFGRGRPRLPHHPHTARGNFRVTRRAATSDEIITAANRIWLTTGEHSDAGQVNVNMKKGRGCAHGGANAQSADRG